MSEATLERFFRREAAKRNIWTEKLRLIQGAGWPDVTCFYPDGRIAFVEMKLPEGRVSRMQERYLTELRRRGFRAEVLRTPEEVEAFFRDA